MPSLKDLIKESTEWKKCGKKRESNRQPHDLEAWALPPCYSSTKRLSLSKYHINITWTGTNKDFFINMSFREFWVVLTLSNQAANASLSLSWKAHYRLEEATTLILFFLKGISWLSAFIEFNRVLIYNDSDHHQIVFLHFFFTSKFCL